MAEGDIPDEGALERGPFDRGRADDVLYGEFGQPTLDVEKAADGLPGVRPSTGMPYAPPLHPDTLVCLADRSSYVMRSRSWGTVVAVFEATMVREAEDGTHYVGIFRALRSGAPWIMALWLFVTRGYRVPVEPVRPQCKFLARQMVDLQDSTEHLLIERLCTARRDEQSFFLSVRDSQVYACELRQPPAIASVRRLDLFDEKKIELGHARRKEHDAFDVDRALSDLADSVHDDRPDGGIFGDSGGKG